MNPKKALKDQPDQFSWLKMGVEDQAYWLLKLINHNREISKIVPEPRERARYQTGTMLIRVDGFDHHNTEVAAVVSHSTNWLISNGYMNQDPAQTAGIFAITPKGYDLIDLHLGAEDKIQDLIEFSQTKNQLEELELEPMDILKLFVSHITKYGKKPQEYRRNIDNNIAVNLSRHENRNITLNSLQKAANYCITHDWLKQRYKSSNTHESLELTESGLTHYELNKNEHRPAATENVHKTVKRHATSTSSTEDNSSKSDYVHASRIEELRNIVHPEYDTARLVQLCVEINLSYKNDCFLAVTALVRTLIDHIPPIFESKNFDEVANNYGGSKIVSFKKNMSHLSNSAKNISDRNLHQQIRRKEPLLNSTQVDFSNDIDVLLQEIVAILG